MYLGVSRILTRESEYSLLAINGLRARLNNRVNVRELLINTVNRNKRNVVDTLKPKGARLVISITSGNTSSYSRRWIGRA